MALTNQMLDALSNEVSAVNALYDTIFRLKKYRQTIDALKLVTNFTEPKGPGSLDHLDAKLVQQALDAMDALDELMVSPRTLGGETTAIAVVLAKIVR
jgi:hypothetical protein